MTEQGCFSPDYRYMEQYLFYRGKVAFMEETLASLEKARIQMNTLSTNLKQLLHRIRHLRDEGVTDLIQPVADQEYLIQQVLDLFDQLELVMSLLDAEPVPYLEEEDDHK